MIRRWRESKDSWAWWGLFVEALKIDILRRNRTTLVLWLPCGECTLWKIGLALWSRLWVSLTCLVCEEFSLRVGWWRLGFPDLGSSVAVFCSLSPERKPTSQPEDISSRHLWASDLRNRWGFLFPLLIWLKLLQQQSHWRRDTTFTFPEPRLESVLEELWGILWGVWSFVYIHHSNIKGLFLIHS